MRTARRSACLIVLMLTGAALGCGDCAASGAEGSTASPFLVASPSSNLMEMYRALTTVGGGVIYLSAPGSYPCPGPPPSNVSLISLAPGADATVASLGFDGIASGIDTQVHFTNCPQWTLTNTYNTRVEGVTLDFGNSGAGLAFVNSQWNHWKHVTLDNCGNPATPCFQMLSNGAASPANNTALNTLEDIVVNPNTQQYATAWMFQGSAEGGAATQNRIVRPIVAGNILCGFDMEANTDSNVISDAQLYQQGTVTDAAPLCFNLTDPTRDIDADGSIFSNFSWTGPYTHSIRMGQTSANKVDFTDLSPLNFLILGGTPRVEMESQGLNGGTGVDDYVGGGRGMRAANATLTFPPGMAEGDFAVAESPTIGKLYLGTNGVTFSTGAGAPSGNCAPGSLYTNSSASSAANVLYVCYPANTWNAAAVSRGSF